MEEDEEDVIEEENIFSDTEVREHNEEHSQQIEIQDDDEVEVEANLIDILDIKNEKHGTLQNYITDEDQIIEDEQDEQEEDLAGHEVLISNIGDNRLLDDECADEDNDEDDEQENNYAESVSEQDDIKVLDGEQIYDEEHLDDQQVR